MPTAAHWSLTDYMKTVFIPENKWKYASSPEAVQLSAVIIASSRFSETVSNQTPSSSNTMCFSVSQFLIAAATVHQTLSSHLCWLIKNWLIADKSFFFFHVSGNSGKPRWFAFWGIFCVPPIWRGKTRPLIFHLSLISSTGSSVELRLSDVWSREIKIIALRFPHFCCINKVRCPLWSVCVTQPADSLEKSSHHTHLNGLIVILRSRLALRVPAMSVGDKSRLSARVCALFPPPSKAPRLSNSRLRRLLRLNWTQSSEACGLIANKEVIL